jgi:hypothetical protein
MVQPTYHNIVVAPIPATEFKGFYGFGQPDTIMSWEKGPVVQVLQYIAKAQAWVPTPARHAATQIANSAPGLGWSIDFGQGWELNAENTDAFREYAKTVLAAESVVV